MDYDFNDSKVLRKIDYLLKKDKKELTDDEIDMIIEYKADVKARNIANTEYLDKLNEASNTAIEYSSKLADLADKEFKLKQREIEIIARIANQDTE